MALSELSALDTAYHILAPLDPAARRRALQWLSDALDQSRPLAVSANEHVADEAVAEAVVPRPRRRRTKSSAVAVAKSANTKTRGRRAQSRNTASAKGDRAYRRMPEPDEVMAAYTQIGTVSGLAEHFDVPTYTVHSWARRLRNLGYQIGRNS